jgi:hypothetical protein
VTGLEFHLQRRANNDRDSAGFTASDRSVKVIADDQAGLVSLRRTGRQGKMVRGPLPGRSRRARGRRTRPSPHRAPSRRGQAASRQDPRRFDFDAVPMISKAHVMAICAGDTWVDMGANLILLGGPGGGKNPLSPRRSVWLSSKMAGASCSPAPPTWSKNSRSRAVNSRSKPPSTA